MKKLLLISLLATVSTVGFSKTNEYFTAKEFSLGVAASWTTPAQGSYDLANGTVGLTVNGTKYFNKYFGATAELNVVDLYNVGNLIVDQFAIGGTARYPIERIAPYGRLLVGRDFQRSLYSMQAGAGVEFRLTPRIGTFAEGRYQFLIDGRDNTVFLGGFSLSF